MRALIALASTLIALLPMPGSTQDEEDRKFTDDFPLRTCDFVPWGVNHHFSLTPGRQLYLTNARCQDRGECDELEELWITVTKDVRKIPVVIAGERQVVTARVIEESEFADGEQVEISRNFFAMCLPARDVYYFGEEVDIYEDGEVVSHEGAWLAGQQGARPGIIMPDSAFLLGTRYFQELAPDVALDQAEHVEAGLTMELPAGTFTKCIRIIETTPLEPGSESQKVYCRGVGLAVDNDLELTAIYDRAEAPSGKPIPRAGN